MNIQDALKETGKAAMGGWDTDRYVFVGGGQLCNVEGHKFANACILKDDWQPYHEEKEIRPEKEGELWKNNVNINWFIRRAGSSRCKGFQAVSEQGVCFDIKGLDMVHGEGWTRLFPPVEEDVERIEIEGVKWKKADHGKHGEGVIPEFPSMEEVRKIEALTSKPPMKMILEIPREEK